MFGLAGLALPLVGNLLGNLFNQGSQGCHGHHHHHHHHHNNIDRAAQDFRMAREDYADARRDFARGDFFGGLQEVAEARQHMADGYAELSGGRGWI